ncbi:hypothetical protein F4818DRAFT_128224 [Hypoxylon cercidicola]|nr:hypothetical protein F4818DRAFT_128224 [Hypoxylon cercidicola]
MIARHRRKILLSARRGGDHLAAEMDAFHNRTSEAERSTDFRRCQWRPRGALCFAISKNKTALLAVCASIVTLAALVMDPFLQLVIDFPSRLTPETDSSPTILTSQVYDPFHLPSRYGHATVLHRSIRSCKQPYYRPSGMLPGHRTFLVTLTLNVASGRQ